MEFKGSKGEWKSIFTSDNRRAVRNKEGIIYILPKPSKYIGQDERYDFELNENKANQLLAMCALEMLKTLIKVNESLLNDSSTIEQIELRKEVEELIKKATTI